MGDLTQILTSSLKDLDEPIIEYISSVLEEKRKKLTGPREIFELIGDFLISSGAAEGPKEALEISSEISNALGIGDKAKPKTSLKPTGNKTTTSPSSPSSSSPTTSPTSTPATTSLTPTTPTTSSSPQPKNIKKENKPKKLKNEAENQESKEKKIRKGVSNAKKGKIKYSVKVKPTEFGMSKSSQNEEKNQEENQDLDKNAFPTLSQSKVSIQSKKVKGNGVIRKEDEEDEQLVEDLKKISLLENKLTETVHRKTNLPLSTEQAKILATNLPELDSPIIEYLAGLLPLAGQNKNQINIVSSKHMYEILGDHLISFDVLETEEEAEKKCKIIYNELKKIMLLLMIMYKLKKKEAKQKEIL